MTSYAAYAEAVSVSRANYYMIKGVFATKCDGAKCMPRDLVYVDLYLVSTVRSDVAGVGAERSDAVRRI